MKDHFEVFPIGVVRKCKQSVMIEIYPAFKDGTLRVDGFSHLVVLFWFHKNDTSSKRDVLQVHPKGDELNPLTGVFGTRSPMRPNPIGISVCQLLSVQERIMHIDEIDAFDGTPVVDIKPCLTKSDSTPEIRVPDWVGA